MAIPLSSVEAGGMKSLAEHIRCQLELKTQTMGHCAIYEDELQRLWPLSEENRKAKIEDFAKQFGFKLSFYKRGYARSLKRRTAQTPDVLDKSADNLSKAGRSWGCIAVIDREGRTLWIADAHRDNGKRFVARADEKLTAFLELEAATRRQCDS